MNEPLSIWASHCPFKSFPESSLIREPFPCKLRAQEWVGIGHPLWPNPFPLCKTIKRPLMCYNYMSFKAKRVAARALGSALDGDYMC